MTPTDEEMLMAYLDGELDELNSARVEQALAGDPELRDRVDAQRRLRERLAAYYGPVADEPVPERLRAMLGPNVVDFGAARARRMPAWPWAAAMAASLVLGLAVGRALPEGGLVSAEDGTIVARGALAEALDTRLVSAQSADAPTRIGVSFARVDGTLCRSFESPDLSGLACREEGAWQLVVTAPGAGPQRGEYRQAGSGNLMVLQVAQDMMAGEPLDAEGERRARDSGWQRIAPAD